MVASGPRKLGRHLLRRGVESERLLYGPADRLLALCLGYSLRSGGRAGYLKKPGRNLERASDFVSESVEQHSRECDRALCPNPTERTNNLHLAEVQVFGVFATAPRNLAAGKAASQSSTIIGAAASNAVDGNTDGNFGHASVTHSNVEANAWWQVDLGASANISSVVVWNRTDCCMERLSDFWVFLSDTPFSASDTPAILQTRAGVWMGRQTGTTDSATFLATGAHARYVRVQLSATNYLSLAEVQVFGDFTPTNLAVGKAASQSSTSMSASASRAVDGNTNGNWASASVTHTNSDANAWWQVDLGASATISSVVVWNRSDCCMERLADYWVFISDTPFSAGDTPATLQTRAGVWRCAKHRFPIRLPASR